MYKYVIFIREYNFVNINIINNYSIYSINIIPI